MPTEHVPSDGTLKLRRGSTNSCSPTSVIPEVSDLDIFLMDQHVISIGSSSLDCTPLRFGGLMELQLGFKEVGAAFHCISRLNWGFV